MQVLGVSICLFVVAAVLGIVFSLCTVSLNGLNFAISVTFFFAAINPGNSGGPALSDDRLIGVAFQGLNQADGIGYIIPVHKHAFFSQKKGELFIHFVSQNRSRLYDACCKSFIG